MSVCAKRKIILGNKVLIHCRGGVWGAISCSVKQEVTQSKNCAFPYYLAGCELWFLSKKQLRKLFSCCLTALNRNYSSLLYGDAEGNLPAPAAAALRVTGSLISRSGACFGKMLDVLKTILSHR